MKYLRLLFIIITFVFSAIIIKYDIKFSSILILVVVYTLYFIINVTIILSFNKRSHLDNYICIILFINYMICCYFESFLIIIILIFLTIYIICKKFSVPLKAIFISATILNIIIAIMITYINSNIDKSIIFKEYSDSKEIAINVIYSDAGATGSAYIYEAERLLINNHIYLIKKLTTNKNFVEVKWIDKSSVCIGNNIYKLT